MAANLIWRPQAREDPLLLVLLDDEDDNASFGVNASQQAGVNGKCRFQRELGACLAQPQSCVAGAAKHGYHR